MIPISTHLAPVRYKSEPFFAVVDAFGRYVQCHSIIYEDEFRVGFGVQSEFGDSLLYDVSLPCNLVALWHAAEILTKMSIIEAELLPYVYLAGFSENIIERPEFIQGTIKKVGQVAYNHVMYKSVPEVIVALVIDGKDLYPNPELRLYSLTQAVRSGTLKWNNRLKQAGVMHPSDEDDEINRREKIVSRYKTIINSYCKNRTLVDEQFDRESLEAALIYFIDIKVKINKLEMIALAGFMGQLTALTYPDSARSDIPDEEYTGIVDEYLLWSADWLHKQRSKAKMTIKSVEEYAEELLDLAEMPNRAKNM